MEFLLIPKQHRLPHFRSLVLKPSDWSRRRTYQAMFRKLQRVVAVSCKRTSPTSHWIVLNKLKHRKLSPTSFANLVNLSNHAVMVSPSVPLAHREFWAPRRAREKPWDGNGPNGLSKVQEVDVPCNDMHDMHDMHCKSANCWATLITVWFACTRNVAWYVMVDLYMISDLCAP